MVSHTRKRNVLHLDERNKMFSDTTKENVLLPGIRNSLLPDVRLFTATYLINNLYQ